MCQLYVGWLWERLDKTTIEYGKATPISMTSYPRLKIILYS